jgi:hypothetical protein
MPLRPKNGANRCRGHAVGQITRCNPPQFRRIVLHHQTEKYTLRLRQQVGVVGILVIIVLLFANLAHLEHLAHRGTLG